MLFYTGEVVEDVVGSESVEPGDALVDDSVHGEGFSGSCLSVGEAGDFSSLKGGIDEGSYCLFVDLGGRLYTYSLLVC